jgi:putative nucleotidyltransferase with HDIG domain
MNGLDTPAPDDDPALQRVIVESRAQRGRRLLERERVVEGAGALLFLAVAGYMALRVHRPLDVPVCAAMVAAYGLSTRVEFRMGSGFTDASQLVFVPMLFVLPTAAVPMLVAIALFLSRLPEYAGRSVPVDRIAVRVNDAWYAVAPAAVLTATGATDVSWANSGIYLLALASQFAFDLATGAVRAWGSGVSVPARTLLSEMRSIFLADALMAPLGLLVAFASAGGDWAFLLVLPLLVLLRVLAREREARIEGALTLSSAYRGTAHLLGELLSASHEYTGGHSRSVVLLSHRVAESLGLDERTLRDVEFGALLHDVGKMSVPNSLINKPGALTDAEWEVMRRHTVEGEEMLTRIGGVLGDVGTVVRTHHERWDGTGYPDGLEGEAIPIAARIIAACDAFNAMTTDRPYRKALPLDTAITELRANAGSQFDPDVVEVLIDLVLAEEAVTDTDSAAAGAEGARDVAGGLSELLKPAANL